MQVQDGLRGKHDGVTQRNLLILGVFRAAVLAYIRKRGVGERQNMGLRVSSENSLPGAQVVVNALVVLVNVAASAVARRKVTGGVARLVGQREVGQERLGSWVYSARGNLVSQEGRSASRAAWAGRVCPYTTRGRVVNGKD